MTARKQRQRFRHETPDGIIEGEMQGSYLRLTRALPPSDDHPDGMEVGQISLETAAMTELCKWWKS